MNQAIEHLSQHITPKTAGIIWLTDEPLGYKTPGVYQFNYLLNGMLIKSISQNENQAKDQLKSNFFLGENFGSPLFIGHAVINTKDDLKIMYHHFDVASSFLRPENTIYIYNRSQNTANFNVLKDLSNKYKDYNFENLNI